MIDVHNFRRLIYFITFYAFLLGVRRAASQYLHQNGFNAGSATNYHNVLPPRNQPNYVRQQPVSGPVQLQGRQAVQPLAAIDAPPPPFQAVSGAYGYPGYGGHNQPPVPPVPVGVASLPPRIDPLLGQEYSYGVYPYGEYGGYGYGYRPYYSGYNYPLWGPFGPPPQWYYLNDKVVGDV